MDNKTLALIGAALLFVGVFMPIVSVPIAGNVNYFMNGRGDGVIVLLLAVVAGGLALAGHMRHLIWPGIAALAMLAFTFVRFQTNMADMRAKMDAELSGNPFRGLADMAVDSMLVLGAGLVTYAGVQSRRTGAIDDISEP